MTQYCPTIVEQESNGAFSAWVASSSNRSTSGARIALRLGTRSRTIHER